MATATPRPLYPGGTDPVHIVQETGWAPGPVWKFWGTQKYFAPAGNRTLHATTHSLVTILTDLPDFT